MGALSSSGVSRSARDYNQAGLAAIVEDSVLRCRIAILNSALVKRMFHDGIGRAATPKPIVVEVEQQSIVFDTRDDWWRGAA